jgi:PAS domain S-box-containing protein
VEEPVQRYTEELRLLHALSLSVLAADASGVVTFANHAAAEMFGVPVEDLVGHAVTDLLGVDPPDDSLPLADVLAGTTWRGDLAVRRRDDDGLVAAVSGTPIRDPEGTVIGAIIALDDMTDIRRAEAEAAESETRLRLAHAAAELGTWHWNALDGTNVWDDQMHHIYGLAPGGFDGTWDAWVASIHPDDRTEAIAIVQRAMDLRSTYLLRHRIVRPDGRPTWIEAHGKVLVDPAGDPAGTIGCVQDVTTRIEMEHRQEDAAARALLLQQVTADFSQALTPDQVAAVHEASLERVGAIVGPDQSVSKEDEQLLDTLASQRAIAEARAELFRHTAAISEELQSSLAASPLPVLERFEIAAYYAPGGDALEQVGGDWYDALPTGTGGLAIVVGDVMGRGVRAATTMIHVRAGIRGLMTVESAPAALLAAADQLMVRDAPEQFVTAAALLADPDAGTLEVCNAGHVPPVLVRPGGVATVIAEGAGAPLGVLPDVDRVSHRLALEPGCVLVLVTDGVVESRERDIDEGIERLRSRAAELAHGPLDELVAGLAALADTGLRDDVTVVAARLR